MGEGSGDLTYIENTGTTTAPVFVQRTGTANPFDGIDVGWYSAPAFGDLDNDGTLRPRPSTDKLRTLIVDSALIQGIFARWSRRRRRNRVEPAEAPAPAAV